MDAIGLETAPREIRSSGTNGSHTTDGIDESVVDSTSVPRTTGRKGKPEPKRIQVVWEQTDGPGYLFLLFAFAVLALVILILALAAYLQ